MSTAELEAEAACGPSEVSPVPPNVRLKTRSSRTLLGDSSCSNQTMCPEYNQHFSCTEVPHTRKYTGEREREDFFTSQGDSLQGDSLQGDGSQEHTDWWTREVTGSCDGAQTWRSGDQ